ncbi:MULTISPECIES: hypothetical protein [Clostridium]|nr:MULTISPECIES: hypothetical protein [Clostridium]
MRKRLTEGAKSIKCGLVHLGNGIRERVDSKYMCNSIFRIINL